MSRYFIKVAYKGTAYAGFQVQENANSIQAEVEQALAVFFKQTIGLTGSSRTDAGVHALENYFHFDADSLPDADRLNRIVYNLNAILPRDIVIKRIYPVPEDAHCRFSAIKREYRYQVYREKDPFLADRAYFFPYPLALDQMQAAAALLQEYRDFSSFSKRNTQVRTFECTIYRSEWYAEGASLVYHVEANRFLRGMVRGLVGTMLRVGTGKLSLDEFRNVIESRDCTRADFSVPPQGLFLVKVHYPEGLLY